jgi:hypothetical protein
MRKRYPSNRVSGTGARRERHSSPGAEEPQSHSAIVTGRGSDRNPAAKTPFKSWEQIVRERVVPFGADERQTKPKHAYDLELSACVRLGDC